MAANGIPAAPATAPTWHGWQPWWPADAAARGQGRQHAGIVGTAGMLAEASGTGAELRRRQDSATAKANMGSG